MQFLSKDVKITLFKSCCLCFYDVALWSSFSSGALNKLRSAYNKCVKICFGYKWFSSVTQMLFQLNLPSFDTLIHDSRFRFSHIWQTCVNRSVMHLRMLCLWCLYICSRLSFVIMPDWLITCAVGLLCFLRYCLYSGVILLSVCLSVWLSLCVFTLWAMLPDTNEWMNLVTIDFFAMRPRRPKPFSLTLPPKLTGKGAGIFCRFTSTQNYHCDVMKRYNSMSFESWRRPA